MAAWGGSGKSSGNNIQERCYNKDQSQPCEDSKESLSFPADILVDNFTD